MYLILWLLAVIAAAVFYFRNLYSRFRNRGVNYLTPVPLLGNTTGVTLGIEHLSTSLQKLYDAYPEDRFVGNYEFTNPVVVLRDVELVKKVTIKDFESFTEHRTVVDDRVDPFWGRNLFSLNGEEWKNMRSTLSPAFTSSKIRLMVPFMWEIGEQMMQSLEKQIEDSKSDSIDVDVKAIMTRHANDVIASCAFGVKLDSQADPDNQFFLMGMEAFTFKFKQMFVFFAYSCFPKLITILKWSMFSQRTQKFFQGLMAKMMRDRESQNIIRPDMIHLLLQAKKGQLQHDDKVKDTDAGFATVEESQIGKQKTKIEWSENDLIAQTLIFLLGGFETTSSFMTLVIAELAVHPDMQERLAQEIKEYDERNQGKVDYSTLQKMVYMDMVVSEALRKWTPGFMIDRICSQDYNLGKPNKDATEDYIMRKGEGLIIPVWAFHRDPKYFPNPEKFDPERFSEDNRHDINPYAYMPFGAGPRNCIGSRFALCEVKATLYQLLRQFEISPSEKTVLPIQMCEKSVNIKMKGGHWFRLRARK